MLTQKGRRQTQMPTRRQYVAATGVSEAQPRVRILTTLYDLVETMQSSMSAEAEDLVVTTMVSLLDSSRITFLRTPDHIKNDRN
jgi:hypothetical protein